MTGPASEQNPVFGEVVSNGREDYTGLPEEDTNSTGVSDVQTWGFLNISPVQFEPKQQTV